MRYATVEALRLQYPITDLYLCIPLNLDTQFFAEYERTSPADDLNDYGWEKERADIGLKLEMELLSGRRDITGYRALKQLQFCSFTRYCQLPL